MMIYGLTEPTGEVRYVGFALDADKRYATHWDEGVRRTHKNAWLRSLRARGLKPGLVILEALEVDQDWRLRERHWIAAMRADGCDLTNGTDGGEGGCIAAAQTPEARAKRAASNRGQKRSPEFCAARAQPKSPEHLRAIAVALAGRSFPHLVGSGNPNAKLTENQVRSIRSLRAEGVSGVEVAARFGVTPALVSLIHRRRVWRHVQEES